VHHDLARIISPEMPMRGDEGQKLSKPRKFYPIRLKWERLRAVASRPYAADELVPGCESRKAAPRRRESNIGTSVVEDLVVEIEFLALTPVADPLLQAEQACDEGEGLRECSGIHPLISH
jgi:hypothetical protein